MVMRSLKAPLKELQHIFTPQGPLQWLWGSGGDEVRDQSSVPTVRMRESDGGFHWEQPGGKRW
jgi:hypothetical protein